MIKENNVGNTAR